MPEVQADRRLITAGEETVLARVHPIPGFPAGVPMKAQEAGHPRVLMIIQDPATVRQIRLNGRRP
jgi:hypothetical protein